MTADITNTTRAAAVTPSDATIIACQRVYVGGTGNLSVQHYEGGPTIVYTAPALGIWHDMYCYRIMAATTATLIVAGY